MPEALSNTGLTSVTAAFEKLSAVDMKRLKARALSRAKKGGLEKLGVSGEELFSEVLYRCAREAEWSAGLKFEAVYMQNLRYAELTLKQKALWRLVSTSDQHVLEAIIDTKTPAPDAGLEARRLLEAILSRLKGDSKTIALGVMRGLKGKDLQQWCGFDDERYNAARKAYRRAILNDGTDEEGSGS